MREQIAQKIIFFLNHFFRKAKWFDVLNKSNEETLSYALKSGEVVLDQFGGNFKDLKDKVVLDLGCGFGGKTAYYASLGVKKIYGVDFRDDFLLVQDHCSKNSLDIEFITLKEDGLLPIKSESIDIVISSAVFEHVVNVEVTLDEIRRILKSNGLFLNRWHPYDTRYGSHVNGLIGIPFVHLMFSEKSIMRAYEKLLKDKTENVGSTLLYKFSGKDLLAYKDIGLFFNFLNIKQMREKVKNSGLEIISKRYYFDKTEVPWVNVLPDYLKTFFIDYEIIISKKI